MHTEQHGLESMAWLRASVLGANDGIVSTASLLLGVAAANVSYETILITGAAGLVAGAMSMATGEYVSVSSQADMENAALAKEKAELASDYHGEHKELTSIYVQRGLDVELAKQVAEQLMAHDALGAHARDELGISEITIARPLQAALASALSFAIGAILPIIMTLLAPDRWIIPAIALSAIISLAFLGGLAAKAGRAPVIPGVVRVTCWSMLAMGLSVAVGALFGTSVG